MKRSLPIVLTLLLLVPIPVRAFAGDEVRPVEIHVSVNDLPPSPDGDDGVVEIPKRTGDAGGPDDNSSEGEADTYTTASTLSAPSDVSTFEGFRFNGVVPPDPAGEAGPTSYVHTVNTRRGARVGVFDKSTGDRVATFRLSQIARSDPSYDGPCRNGLGDGVPLYDQLAGRWLLTEFSAKGHAVCIYLSDTNDPATTATWALYEFKMPTFPDYPKWAITPTAYYMGYNNVRGGIPMVAFDRPAMLASQPTIPVVRLAPRLHKLGFQLLTPVDLEGPNLPVATKGIFVRQWDAQVQGSGVDSIEIFEFMPNFANPGASTIANVRVGVSQFDQRVCGLRAISCIPQAGTRTKLDPLREPVMNRPVLRSSGTDDFVYGSFVTDVNGRDRAGVFWFELKRTAAGVWSSVTDGVISPDGTDRWIPSISVNSSDAIAIGYSASSHRIHPQIRIADATTGAETVAKRGRGSQHFAGFAGARWGDYSEMSVDPADDSFWYCNEYIDGRGLWHTAFVNFTLS